MTVATLINLNSILPIPLSLKVILLWQHQFPLITQHIFTNWQLLKHCNPNIFWQIIVFLRLGNPVNLSPKPWENCKLLILWQPHYWQINLFLWLGNHINLSLYPWRILKVLCCANHNLFWQINLFLRIGNRGAFLSL